MRVHERNRAVVERHVEILAETGALTLNHRHQDAERGVEPGAHVDQRDPEPGGPALLGPVHAEHARHRLDDRVIPGESPVGALRSEPADARVDERGVALLQHVTVAEPPLLHGAGTVVLQQHVGPLEQAQQHRAPFLPAEVERHRPLVAVDADEVGGIPLVEGWAPVAGLVSVRGLDLKDGGPVVAENLGAVGTAEHAAQIDDLESGERAEGGIRCSPAARAFPPPEPGPGAFPRVVLAPDVSPVAEGVDETEEVGVVDFADSARGAPAPRRSGRGA